MSARERLEYRAKSLPPWMREDFLEDIKEHRAEVLREAADDAAAWAWGNEFPYGSAAHETAARLRRMAEKEPHSEPSEDLYRELPNNGCG